MKLSIIMPAYNEMATIAEAIRRVLDAPIEYPKELIIVDDCSTDGTGTYLHHLLKDQGIREVRGELKVLFHEQNLGKGAAISTALQHVTGEVVIIQDADLEYDPKDYAILLKPMLDHGADVVFGNRFHGGAHRVLYFWHYVANRFLTTICNVMTNLNLTDMEVGYKIISTNIFKTIQIRSRRFGFEPEITIKVAKRGCRIYEVPISYHGRTYAEGKKISWRDGLAALYHMIYYRFIDKDL